ncbi:unnamed protein product [Rotaria socialis]
MCLCDDYGSQRSANCFEFNHNMKFDCSSQSVCENEGQCFQDSSDCSKNSTYTCQPRFYGSRCQFSSNGFVLSLDTIIGYHNQPHTNIIHQPIIIKITVALTVIFMKIWYPDAQYWLIQTRKKEKKSNVDNTKGDEEKKKRNEIMQGMNSDIDPIPLQ